MKTGTGHIGPEMFAAYLSGELNVEERARVEAWIASSEENQREFRIYREIWRHAQPEPDTEAALERVLDRIGAWEALQASKKGNWHILPLKIAAVLLPLAIVGYFLVNRLYNPDILEVSSGTETLEERLPDGSLALLNKNTTIIYPEGLTGKNREVKLRGEAFFSVEKDPVREFVVNTEGLYVKVLGTEFNVKAYDGLDTVRVSVVEGRVSLVVHDQKRLKDSLLLTAGEEGLYLKREQRLELMPSFDPNVIYWKSGILHFSKMPLGNVVRQLGSAYGTRIILEDTGLADLPLSTTFENLSLEKTMDILAETFMLEWKETDTAIVVYARAPLDH